MKTIDNDVEDVALQAIEIWSSICDTEIELALVEKEHSDIGQVSPIKNFKFIHNALGSWKYNVYVLNGLYSNYLLFTVYFSSNFSTFFSKYYHQLLL